jgi:hypothetical protein
MINVSRLAGRPQVARVDAPLTQLLVAPGQSRAAPKSAAILFRTGVGGRLALLALLKLRLPAPQGGTATVIATRVRIARARLAQARHAADEAALAALDANVQALADALDGT